MVLYFLDHVLFIFCNINVYSLVCKLLICHWSCLFWCFLGTNGIKTMYECLAPGKTSTQDRWFYELFQSDQHGISSFNFNTLSNRKVRRIQKIIKFFCLFLEPWEKSYSEQMGAYRSNLARIDYKLSWITGEWNI